MRFDATKLDEYFNNVERFDQSNLKLYSYSLTGPTGTIAQLTFFSKNELRIFIDNFPRQKLYYQTNFPIHTVEEFLHEMNRINLTFEQKV